VGETTNKGNMTDRKTQRKNKTNLVMTWPANDEYFTIKSLWKVLNPDFVEITLRVRLKKAIDGEGCPVSVKEIGYKNTGFGRPIKVFVTLPVNPLAVEKAKADGIMLNSPSVPVIQVNPSTPITVVSPIPVTNITKPNPVMA
jgi:hypothetical protein